MLVVCLFEIYRLVWLVGSILLVLTAKCHLVAAIVVIPMIQKIFFRTHQHGQQCSNFSTCPLYPKQDSVNTCQCKTAINPSSGPYAKMLDLNCMCFRISLKWREQDPVIYILVLSFFHSCHDLPSVMSQCVPKSRSQTQPQTLPLGFHLSQASSWLGQILCNRRVEKALQADFLTPYIYSLFLIPVQYWLYRSGPLI